mmetsp:Transcript_8421/g.18354  ORF Transcript_8421/g.18354 Transcript_8421/m.18354 type:complete len:230 (+) Transcript_8421:634-1323(+)
MRPFCQLSSALGQAATTHAGLQVRRTTRARRTSAPLLTVALQLARVTLTVGALSETATQARSTPRTPLSRRRRGTWKSYQIWRRVCILRASMASSSRRARATRSRRTLTPSACPSATPWCRLQAGSGTGSRSQGFSTSRATGKPCTWSPSVHLARGHERSQREKASSSLSSVRLTHAVAPTLSLSQLVLCSPCCASPSTPSAESRPTAFKVTQVCASRVIGREDHWYRC